jgi:glycosyltransferase involved in cell wall biosynthesis
MHEFLVREDALHLMLPPSVVLRLVSALSKLVVVPSHALATEVLGPIALHKVAIVPPAVELGVPPRAPSMGPIPPIRRMLVLGPRRPVKRQAEAICALRLLHDWGIEMRLTMLGPAEGAYAAALEAKAVELGVSDFIETSNFASDVWLNVGDDTVVVNCGASETFGRVTIEAMRRSIPVVAADSKGSAELIRDGKTGLLYAVGDPNSLATRVATLCSSRDLRRTLVRDAFEWSTSPRFSNKAYAARMAALIRQAGGSQN